MIWIVVRCVFGVGLLAAVSGYAKDEGVLSGATAVMLLPAGIAVWVLAEIGLFLRAPKAYVAYADIDGEQGVVKVRTHDYPREGEQVQAAALIGRGVSSLNGPPSSQVLLKRESGCLHVTAEVRRGIVVPGHAD